MAARLGVIPVSERSTVELAAWSAAALDRPLYGDAAQLVVTIARDDAVLLGAFQRGAALASSGRLFRRGSGGPAIRVGPGTLHVLLALDSAPALLPCAESRIVNRYVRPLLRALTRAGHLAHYFGADWIAVGHRPVGWVGFAHDASSGRAAFEAFVAITTPFALGQRSVFRGKADGTLAEIAGETVAPARLAAGIVAAYADIATHQEWREAADASVNNGSEPQD